MTDADRPTNDLPSAEARDRLDPAKAGDALKAALSGSDMGSDTRAGSLRGGSASGSDVDPDQADINQSLAAQGQKAAASQPPAGGDPVVNTGDDQKAKAPQKDADAATG
ncbi:ribonuclease [Brevundimonas aurifodinae]|uniref:Ribonuclease n=1 Tax=Brevundimonas aurifodinae TaxID=1508312 RepID=A0ABV1NMY7_9CAUL